jgi:PKD repeat protein
VALVGSDLDTAAPLSTVRVPKVTWYVGTPSTTQASIDLETPIGTAGSSVNFDASGSGGTGLTYQWNFGDNSAGSTDAVVSHAYANPGLYNVSVSIVDNTGRTSQKTMQVAVLPEIQNISPNLSLKGSDVASFDAGDPLPGFDYQWNFGDASTGTGSRISHTYPTLGTYVVKLKIIDNRPLTRSKTNRISGGGSTAYQNETWITRWEPKPKAKFSLSSSLGAGASFGLAPYLVNFDASASSGSTALTYAWSFGDNTTGTGATTSHTFAPGENIVKLTVTDAKGQKDTYKAYVTAKQSDIPGPQVQNAFFRPVFTYPSTTRAKIVDPLELLPASKSTPLSYAQAKSSTRSGTNYIDYNPYVMHKSASLTRIPTRWNAWSNGGNYRSVFCSEIRTYYNTVQTQNLQFQNPSNTSLCDFVQIRNVDIPVLKTQGNSEVFVTSSLFDQTYRFDVFGGLRVPHVYVAVVPDKMIPGEIASPYVTENIGNFNGTKELMLTVRVRQSELLNSNLKFKVPVYAVDDAGALMTTANGYFKAAFKTGNTAVTTDCGECVMENGKAYIEVTVPNTAYALASAGINLTQVSVYGNPNCVTDNSDWVNKMPDNALLNNCNTVTATYVPPTGIAGVPDFKYPIPTETTTFRNHILTGGLATDVNKWRSYTQDGFWEDGKNFVTSFIPFIGSGKDFLASVKACQAQECSTLGVGMIVLASVGVIADITPATGAIYAKFAKVFKPSKLTTKGVSNALEQVIKEGVDATKTINGISTDLDTAFSKVAKSINDCGEQCRSGSERISVKLKLEGSTDKDALKSVNDALKDIDPDLATSSRVLFTELFPNCVRAAVGSVSTGVVQTRALGSGTSVFSWCQALINLRLSFGSFFSMNPPNSTDYSDSIVHILMGNTKNGTRQLTGGHLESALPTGSIVTTVVPDSRNPLIYQCEIFWTDANGILFRKPRSTMFPKTWTPNQTLQEIVSAYQNAAMNGGINGNYFKGKSTSGIEIEGRLDTNSKITQANPTFVP